MSELPHDFGDPGASTNLAGEAPAGSATALFAPRDVFARIAERALPDVPDGALDRTLLPPHGDHILNDWIVEPAFLAGSRIAAVLVGLVEREGALTVLLTQRASALRVHSGQIAFPGGKMDPADATPADAALREAWEEIGLAPDRVRILGYLPPYLSGSGFRILPVLARIASPFETELNPDEVEEVFEVPFGFLMTAANHQLRHREWKGKPRKFYAIPYQDRHIWGITAGIIRTLHDRLYL